MAAVSITLKEWPLPSPTPTFALTLGQSLMLPPLLQEHKRTAPSLPDYLLLVRAHPLGHLLQEALHDSTV